MKAKRPQKPNGVVRYRSTKEDHYVIKSAPSPEAQAQPSTTLVRRYQEPPAERIARNEAFTEACRRFGDGAVVGQNLHDDTFYVGRRSHGEWLEKGVGATWKEAFADAKPVVPKSK